MSRISQELARRIAEKMTEKKFKQVDKLKKAFHQLVTDAYKRAIPKSILEVREKFPEYFMLTGRIILDGHGFDHDHIPVIGPDLITNSDHRARLKMTPELATEIKKTQWAFEKERDSYTKLVDEIYQAIMALGSYKQIREKFPEAGQYLPDVGPRSLALIPNLDALKEKIKHQVA